MENYKFLNAFQPNNENKEKLSQAQKDYKYCCFLPESQVIVGDSYIFFNDKDLLYTDLDKEDGFGMKDYIKQYIKESNSFKFYWDERKEKEETTD